MNDENRGQTTAKEPPSDLFNQFANAAGFAPREDQLPAARAVADDFSKALDGVLADPDRSGTVPKRPHAVLSKLLQAIDDKLSAQVNEVIHHPEFQKVESTWKGLHYLIDQTKPDPMIKFKVLDASKEALLEDIESATREDLSALFVKVYEQNFGIYGGQPVGLLVGDYEFTAESEDVALLSSISRVAAAAHAPFVSGTGSAMFGCKDYTKLEDKVDLKPIFDPHLNPKYAPWDAFRESEDSRFTALCMPHILLREPYKKREALFQFQEEVLKKKDDGTIDAKDISSFLWGNAAYALAARITNAFHRHRWCVAIRGPKGGGLVEGLPNFTFDTERGDVAQTCPTEIAFTDRRTRELSELGFIPLQHCQASTKAAFFATPTCQKPKLWNTDEATASAFLSSRLPFIMATSRFAHYLKVMMRDYVGDSLSREDCEYHLRDWISQYVTKASPLSAEDKRVKPLSDAQITVLDDPARPGCYRAIALLRPHFQLEELTVSLRLVAELPQQSGR